MVMRPPAFYYNRIIRASGQAGRCVLAPEHLGRDQPLEFTGPANWQAIEADRGNAALGETHQAVRLSDQGGGDAIDVGGVTDPGHLLVFAALAGCPRKQAIQVAARSQFIELDDLRLAGNVGDQHFGRLLAAHQRAGGHHVGPHAPVGQFLHDLGKPRLAFRRQRPQVVVGPVVAPVGGPGMTDDVEVHGGVPR